MPESISRREFLRGSLAVAVVASTSPLVVLGRVVPELHTNADGTVVATYVLFLKDYPALAEIDGSVKLKEPNQLLLNPDHVQRAFTGKSFPIAITRVSDTGPNDFVAVSTYCTHGFDFEVADFNPITGHFVCPHKHSTFLADGTHIEIDQPTPPVGNLRRFPATYDAGAGTITLQNVLAVADIPPAEDIPDSAFLDQNYPNPFNPATLIRYGIPEGTQATITIHSLDGAAVATIVDSWHEAGTYTIDFSARDIPSGTYFYRLETTDGKLTRRMVVRK